MTDVETFIDSAMWHGGLERAKAMLAADPGAVTGTWPSVGVRDGNGRSPLMLAVRACVDSYWTRRRKPDSVKALLDAGAGIEGVMFPSGYEKVDDLLRQRGAR